MLELARKGTRPSSAGYYSPKWRNIVENHLQYLRNHPQTTHKETMNLEAYRSRYDINSMLIELSIPEKYFWIIMRVNGFSDQMEFHEDVTHLLIPAASTIEELYSKTMRS